MSKTGDFIGKALVLIATSLFIILLIRNTNEYRTDIPLSNSILLYPLTHIRVSSCARVIEIFIDARP